MTAKHRKGKNNHTHEDNFFKNDVMESEVRTGGNSYTLALVIVVVVVLGGAIGSWFCFQQHQTLTYLTDNLMGIQMKIAKLQSSHEEFRQSNGKHNSDGLVSRLNALEESYSLAQKQVGMALATTEQLKTSDLPAQVLSLHTEMKTRLAEMQQATVSVDELGHIQSLLQGNSEAFEGVKLKLEALMTLGDGLSLKVEALESNLGAAESKLTEQVATLSASLIGQAAEVLSLKKKLGEVSVRAEMETEASPAILEEQLQLVLEESAAEVLEKEEAPGEEIVVETIEELPLIDGEELPLSDEASSAELAEEEVKEDFVEEELPVEEEAEEVLQEPAPAAEEVTETEPAEDQEDIQTEELNIEASTEAEAPAEEVAETTDEGTAEEEAQEVGETQEDVPEEEEKSLEQLTEDQAEEEAAAQAEEEVETEEQPEETAEQIATEIAEETVELPEEDNEAGVQEDSPAEDTNTVEEAEIPEKRRLKKHRGQIVHPTGMDF
uniref:Uncharacterized protein n=1 Tax=Knipowitschia caucasica TaxID=637954 RepID=A0AAV2LZS6_KNICA